MLKIPLSYGLEFQVGNVKETTTGIIMPQGAQVVTPPKKRCGKSGLRKAWDRAAKSDW